MPRKNLESPFTCIHFPAKRDGVRVLAIEGEVHEKL